MIAPSCTTCRHGEYDSGEPDVGCAPSYDCGAPEVDDAIFEHDAADDPAWLAAHCGHYDPIPAGHCGQCHNPIPGPWHAVAHWCEEPWADQPSPACCAECAHASRLDMARWEWLEEQRRDLDERIHDGAAELDALFDRCAHIPGCGLCVQDLTGCDAN